VFYHLRYPLLALDLLYEFAVADLLVFQSMLRGSKELASIEEDYPFSEQEIFDKPEFPKMAFIEKSYSSDPTNWWIPNRAAMEALLRSASFQIINRPEEEVYFCRRIKRTERVLPFPARS
jgi:tRNA (mo5U34)-methyltransferase